MRSNLAESPSLPQTSNVRSSSNRLTPAELERNSRIEEYFPLVTTVIEKLRKNLPSFVNVDDLHGVGVMGLVAAAERFAPEKSSSFAGYASIRIRGAILDELRRMDPTSRRSRQVTKTIEKATQEAAQNLGRTPNDEDVSAHLQVSLAEFERLRQTASPIRIVSLDSPMEADTPESASFHEVIPDLDQPCVRDTLQREDLMKLLAQRISELPDLQKKVLALYYFEGMRFVEIAQAFELTESRICQIHKQAVTKLHGWLRSERGR